MSEIITEQMRRFSRADRCSISLMQETDFISILSVQLVQMTDVLSMQLCKYDELDAL